MVSRSSEEEKGIPTTEVLNAGDSLFFTAASLEFGNSDLVLSQEFLIDLKRIFVFGNVTEDVEPVAALHVAHGGLLDKSADGMGKVSVVHP